MKKLPRITCDGTIGVHGADRVAVLGEGELDGGQGVTGFEGADFGLADSVKFLEGEGAGAAVGGEIGKARQEAGCSAFFIRFSGFRQDLDKSADPRKALSRGQGGVRAYNGLSGVTEQPINMPKHLYDGWCDFKVKDISNGRRLHLLAERDGSAPGSLLRVIEPSFSPEMSDVFWAKQFYVFGPLTRRGRVIGAR